MIEGKNIIKILITVFLIISAYYTLASLGCLPRIETPGQRAKVVKTLSSLDNNQHSPQQFLSILNDLHDNHPRYSHLQIADAITRTWNGHKNIGDDISLYTVAMNIRQLSEENPGVDFAEILAAYMMKRSFRPKTKY